MKNVVIFIQTILSFVLPRKIINIYNNIAHKYGNVIVKVKYLFIAIHSWQSGSKLLPNFIRIASILPHFSNFIQPSLPCHLQPPPRFLFLWLNGWLCHNGCAILVNDSMDLHMLSHSRLVQEGSRCLFYATRCQVY